MKMWEMGRIDKILRESVYFPFGKRNGFFVCLFVSTTLVLFVCLVHSVVNHQSLLITFFVTSTLRIAGNIEIVSNTHVPRGQRPVCEL